MNPTEKRKSFIISTVYFTIIVLLAYLFLKYAFGLFFPLFVGFFIAMLLQKPMVFISEHTKIPKKAVGAVLTFLTFGLLISVFALLGVNLMSQFKGFVSYLAEIVQDFPAFLDSLESKLRDMLSFLPSDMNQSVNESISAGIENLKNTKISDLDIMPFFNPLGSIWGAAKQLPSHFITCLITIISTLFITMDYRIIVSFIRAQLSDKHKTLLTDAKKIFFNTIWKMIKAYLIIMSITCVELFISFSILRLEYALVLALIICIVDVLPVLGTGTVIIPWALYEFVMGNSKLALGLVVMYIIITVIRNFIEPKIIGHSVGLHPVVTLTAMYVGLRLFGFFGMLMLPVIIIMMKVLQDNGNFRIWKTPQDGIKEQVQTAEKEK